MTRSGVGPTLPASVASRRSVDSLAAGRSWAPEVVTCRKYLKCADVMGDCNTVIVGKDADEVFAKAEAHARKEHNMTIITPSVMSQIEAAIKDR